MKRIFVQHDYVYRPPITHRWSGPMATPNPVTLWQRFVAHIKFHRVHEFVVLGAIAMFVSWWMS